MQLAIQFNRHMSVCLSVCLSVFLSGCLLILFPGFPRPCSNTFLVFVFKENCLIFLFEQSENSKAWREIFRLMCVCLCVCVCVCVCASLCACVCVCGVFVFYVRSVHIRTRMVKKYKKNSKRHLFV